MDIKKLKSKQRFSNLVDDYNKFRPGYPSKIIEVLQNEYNLNSSSIIADIGSGTGKLTILFIDNRNKVFAVEPNDNMRNSAEKIFSDNRNFFSINGSAEETALENSYVDFIVVGQAFHWYDLYKEKEIIKFFKPKFVKKYSFNNNQIYNIDEFIGRVKSTSYCPDEDSKFYKPLIQKLEDLFKKYKKNGKITFMTNTIMFVSR